MNMIGLTVGTGGHLPLAQEAARRFELCTGLPVTILGDREYEDSGCLNPSLMRTYAFDYVDADTVIYFDADILFCRQWNPAEVIDGKLQVVRDVNYAAHVIDECMEKFGATSANYFNAGLMIMNRGHADYLRVARRLTEDVILDASPFMEQTALNMAVGIMDVEVSYLPRVFNWLVTARESIEAGIPVIGAHKWRSLQSAGDQLAESHHLDMPFEDYELYQEFAGFYKYERVGHDSRDIELRADGTIGQGCSRMEWWWVVAFRDGVPHIAIRGYTTISDRSELTTTWLRKDTSGFSGQWEHFEKMPIKLARYDERPEPRAPYGRARVLHRLLDGIANPRIAEIGVYRGETTAYLAAAIPSANILAVDVWAPPPTGSEYAATGDYIANQDDKRHRLNMLDAMWALYPYGKRIRVRKATSEQAYRNTPGSLFDLVFLDADHSYKAVSKDISMWRNRVKSGGILAGHDYNHPTRNGTTFGPQVKQAVDEFVATAKLELHLEDDYVWWVRL